MRLPEQKIFKIRIGHIPNINMFMYPRQHKFKLVEIKGPESWWIAKSITISRVVNQSKVNPIVD